MEFKETEYSEEIKDEEEQINIEEEVPEVKMSVKKTMWVLMGFFLFVLIVMLFVRACSARGNAQRSAQNSKVQTEASVNSDVPISSTGVEKENVVENNTNSKASDSSRETSSTSSENSVKVEEAVSVKEPEKEVQTTGSINEFQEQSESTLQLTDKVETNGLVSSKKVYKFKDSYIYGIEIVILVDEGEEVTSQYFCPYKTYSSVKVGDTLKVSYQKDASGSVSIYSIG